jgi:hypothetical protein
MPFLDTAEQRRCLQTLCKPCKSPRLRWRHCPASSVSGNIALLLHSTTDPGQYNRSVLCPVRARSLVNLPAVHVGIEKTEIGHCPSVCAAFVNPAMLCLTCLRAQFPRPPDSFYHAFS